MPRVLNQDQIDQFVELGYTRLEEAYPRHAALAAQEFLWEKLAARGVVREDRSTWPPMVGINENYTDPLFRACETPRLREAVIDLLGEGRWNERGAGDGWGWWPVNFPNPDRPWAIPAAWHWDGADRTHFVDSPDQGLLVLCLFSETGPRGGGTLVVEGSHRVIARFLHAHPGLDLLDAIKQCQANHPWLNELTTDAPDVDPEARAARFMDTPYTDDDGGQLIVREVTGLPGDVYLCHPFLFHTSSVNHADVPRFMCNRKTPLHEPIRYDRPDSEASPLERSIRRALTPHTPADATG